MLEKFGSGKATGTERANSAQFIRLLRKTTALEQAKGETPIKKYSNIIPSNLGSFSCVATKKNLVDLPVLARVKILECFLIQIAYTI